MGLNDGRLQASSGSSVLTGDALVTDVVDGKFFYSDNPNEKLEGTLVQLDTSDATATAADMLTGKTAYTNGQKTTGSMPNNAGDVAAVSGRISGSTLHILPAAGYVDGADDAATIAFASLLPSGMFAWYDANQLSLSDNDDVSTWTDMSGNGFHATQSTADKKPHFKTNVVNGKPVVRFDGTDDCLAISGSASTMKTLHYDSSTIFIVCRIGIDANPGRFLTIMGNHSTASAAIGFTLFYDDRATPGDKVAHFVAQGVQDNNPIENTSAAGFLSPNTFHMFWINSDPGNATAALRSKIILNGTASVASNTKTNNRSANDATYDLQIGAAGTDNYHFLGDIAEIIIYNSLLTSAQIAPIVFYLLAKYDLGITLD